jgi:type I restriction enzyme, S subunit
MAIWQEFALKDVCSLITDGAHNSPSSVLEGKPMASVKDLTPFGIRLETCRRISSVDFEKLVRQGCLPIKGDVLIAKDGATAFDTVCEVKQNNEVVLLSSVAILRPNPSVIDSSFLRYYLDSSKTRSYLKSSFISGAAIPRVVLKDLKRAAVRVPPLPIQRRIVDILSAYDDLIENNLRRIRILEEMARSIYREWFVHFRFPGNENVPRVDSSLGPIPEGWIVKKLNEIAVVNRAQINTRTAPEQLHYIDISSVSTGQIDSITTYAFAEAPGRARRIVQHGDVIWSCVRPNRRSHALIMNPEPDTIASTGFAVLTATEVPFPFLYFATTTDEFVAFLTNNATGAAYPAVTAMTFEKADLLVPPAPLLNRFGDFAIPVIEQIYTLQRKNQSLRTTRDLLLPRLLLGTIDVSEADFSSSSERNNKSMVVPITSPQTRSTAVPVSAREFPRSEKGLSPTAGGTADGLVPSHAKDKPDADDGQPPPIDQTDRSNVLAVIRQVFGDGRPRNRQDAIRQVAQALGYGRVGRRINDVLQTDLLIAVRRGILDNVEGELILLARSITDYDRDLLKRQFLAAVGRSWIERDEAIQNFCRWMGFRRTGQIIDETARSLIQGLLRESRLEADGPNLIRRSS